MHRAGSCTGAPATGAIITYQGRFSVFQTCGFCVFSRRGCCCVGVVFWKNASFGFKILRTPSHSKVFFCGLPDLHVPF